jgi:hypothetical protein
MTVSSTPSAMKRGVYIHSADILSARDFCYKSDHREGEKGIESVGLKTLYRHKMSPCRELWINARVNISNWLGWLFDLDWKYLIICTA